MTRFIAVNVERDDLVVESGPAGVMLSNELRLKDTQAIAR